MEEYDFKLFEIKLSKILTAENTTCITSNMDRRSEDRSARQLWIHWSYSLPERFINHDILQ
jgi:hypothetical protein